MIDFTNLIMYKYLLLFKFENNAFVYFIAFKDWW